jgi:hypothetical protein
MRVNQISIGILRNKNTKIYAEGHGKIDKKSIPVYL